MSALCLQCYLQEADDKTERILDCRVRDTVFRSTKTKCFNINMDQSLQPTAHQHNAAETKASVSSWASYWTDSGNVTYCTVSR